MTKINVKHDVLDDDLLYRKTKIQCGDISVTTPVNSTDTKIIHSQINEIYKKINSKDLDSAVRIDESLLFNKFKYSLTEGAINFPIINYDDTIFPENKNMEMLADLCYEAGDVIVTPSWTSLLTQYEGEELIKKLNELNNSFIERAKMKNNKTVVGLIPNKLPRFYLDDLLTTFFDNEISSFIVDCNGKSIDSGSKTWMRNLLLTLDSFKDDGFLYSINSYEGRFSKNSYSTAAKDYLSHGYGIDILGLNHIPPKLPESVWKEIEMKNDRTYKIFDRETYGYKRLLEDELKEYSQINIKEDTKIPDLNKLRRVYNIAEKNKEDNILKQHLDEEQSVKKYVSEKNHVDSKFLENTEKIKKKIRRN